MDSIENYKDLDKNIYYKNIKDENVKDENTKDENTKDYVSFNFSL